jgi:hypothetical protein
MSESFIYKYKLFRFSGSQGKKIQFLHFHYYFPLGSGPGPLFEQFKIPFTQG